MGRIRTLDPSLVSKIAAGEVIERPASVVKELMENALDAGATRIEVELADGGAVLIRVTDDGAGLAPDELPLAVAPHATSKIASVDDLFRIGTLGFRGEALASIAAVAELRIVSRPPDAQAGAEILAVDGRVSAPRPCPAPPGTTVEVRNLFFNVPARRKFLRAAATELAQVSEQVARGALAHPGVALRQIHQGRTLRNLPASGDVRARIADFYGPQLAADLFPLHVRPRDLRIDGFFAPPASARVTPKWQYVFLNGRFISDRFIKFALREAFRGLVEPARHPVVFLFLEMDPGGYDVNVHPTKIEVRWRDAGMVQSQVQVALREALLSRDLTPAARARPAGDEDASRAQRVQQAIVDFLRAAGPPQRILDLPPPVRAAAPRIEPFVPSGPRGTDPPIEAGPINLSQPRERYAGDVSGVPFGVPGPADQSGDAAPPAAADAAPPGLPRALQVHNTYLVVEASDGLMIIDQHALHERLLYEQLRERILAGPLESQRLLIPEPIEASSLLRSAAEANVALLARLGIELSPFGPDRLAVQAFPTFLHRVSPGPFVRDVLDRLAEPGQSEHPESLVHALLDMMACKAAVKAGDALSAEEIDALLAQRQVVERSSNCPHGRPTTLRLSLDDLERQFKRT